MTEQPGGVSAGLASCLYEKKAMFANRRLHGTISTGISPEKTEHRERKRKMAYYRIDYFSNALHRGTSFEMLIPNDLPEGMPEPEKPMKTLFLLHGYTGKAGNWVPDDLPVKYNFAIVMPSAENSFYLDGLSTGHAFQTMVGIELVDYVRKTSGRRSAWRRSRRTRSLQASPWADSARCTPGWRIRTGSGRSGRFPRH